MTTPTARGAPPAEPFFLDGAPGRRFCLFHPPAGACRGAILYVHPFAEEMNRARRMAALQARALAARGYGVLQLDLYGCGDSSGDFADARWALWKDDLARGAAWLETRCGGALTLWGLRLGALLALDYARDRERNGAAHAAKPLQGVLLWQPVGKGSTYLTQFLRLHGAGGLLDDGAPRQGTDALRQALRDGETVEIAGYELAPELAAALDALDPLEALVPRCPVHWFEAVNTPGQDLPPGAKRVVEAWRRHGIALQTHVMACPPFWSTAETVVNQPWLAGTTAALEAGHGH